MQDLIKNVKEGEMTNFQIASCTLDAGAKIYAGRVDSIHTQAYKMLSGLGRTENDQGKNSPRQKPKNNLFVFWIVIVFFFFKENQGENVADDAPGGKQRTRKVIIK